MDSTSDSDRSFLSAVSRLTYCNPFTPERIQHERAALGEAFVAGDPVWSLRGGSGRDRPNVARILARAEELAPGIRDAILAARRPGAEEILLYEDLAIFILYHRHRDAMARMLLDAPGETPAKPYSSFAADADGLLKLPGIRFPEPNDPPHLFACCFQVLRAFDQIFETIVGSSTPAARLRAAVWQSIFTHDMRRYRRTLFARMEDFPTLVIGPSGTGKELVARAVALSRFIPYDPRRGTFAAAANPADAFHPLNLSALSPTLVESELFGHRRGAFTGAVEDRAGWLEACGPHGTVFLDEIGEADPSIQVKLLRVLQTRAFARMGETKPRRFQGKIIAATNRDLSRAIAEGTFRTDFYYRLCADVIETPSLAAQLADAPGDLAELAGFIAARLADPAEAPRLAREAAAWIGRHLGNRYPWPGNIRELEQCIRNLLVRGEYRPLAPAARPGSPRQELAAAVASGSLDAGTLLGRYAALLYHETGSYEETAHRLKLDRRTAKGRIDREFLGRLQRDPA